MITNRNLDSHLPSYVIGALVDPRDLCILVRHHRPDGTPCFKAVVPYILIIVSLSVQRLCILSCLYRLNALITVNQIFANSTCCPKGRPAPPSDLIQAPLNVASGVLKIDKNPNLNLVIEYQKVLDPFYKQSIIKTFKKYSKNYSSTFSNSSKIVSSNIVVLWIFSDFWYGAFFYYLQKL